MAISNAFNSHGGTTPDPASNVLQIFFEDKSSLVNGERVRFSTDRAFDVGSLVVWLNGIKQRASEVSIINATQFDLPSAPLSGDILEVRYSTTT